jgi:hypothetical protein
MDTKTYNMATVEQLKELLKTKFHRRTYGGEEELPCAYAIQPPESPFAETLTADLGFPVPEVMAKPAVVSDRNHSHYYNYTGYNHATMSYGDTPKAAAKELDGLPMFVMVNVASYHHTNHKVKLTPKLEELAKTVQAPTLLGLLGRSNYYGYNHYPHDCPTQNANVAVSVEFGGSRFFLVLPFGMAERVFGLEITDDMQLRTSNGATGEFGDHKTLFSRMTIYRNRDYKQQITKFDFTFDTLAEVERRVGCGTKNLNRLLKGMAADAQIEQPGKLEGIKKTYQRLEPVMNEIRVSDPLALTAYRSLAMSCNRSVDGVKIGAVFNELFEKVTDKAGFSAAIKGVYASKSGDLHTAHNRLEEGIKSLDVYKTKRKAALKSQANRAFTKLQEEAESLTIDKKKHKLTWAKIEAGELPIGTFFRKSEQYFLLNDNWDLWEEMFKRGLDEQAIALANEVKGRTTYEKDLMSYLYFVLYGLPEYLKKQTGHKWTCTPKLVTSASELEPPKADTGGVARQRSALTPVVDNDAHTVEVPYASLAIGGGFGTTYCYSHDYHVLTRGFSFHGYAVTSDIEKGLNGRDDYGLMFYTLTGSAQGRGYPTFLIIFERREQKGDTKVHFHRTHPFRSKEGDYNPIHNWTKGCYNWMAGNIKADRIKAQQGDLFFVQVKTDAADDLDGAVVKGLKFDHKVNQYDKHTFAESVPFAEYDKAAKTNVLGYVRLDSDTMLTHTEHDDVKIPAGTYAIHQCRSWEANPKGVWSLRID